MLVAEAENVFKEIVVQARVTESLALESVDEVSITGGKASKGSEDDLRNERLCRLRGSRGGREGFVRLL